MSHGVDIEASMDTKDTSRCAGRGAAGGRTRGSAETPDESGPTATRTNSWADAFATRMIYTTAAVSTKNSTRQNSCCVLSSSTNVSRSSPFFAARVFIKMIPPRKIVRFLELGNSSAFHHQKGLKRYRLRPQLTASHWRSSGSAGGRIRREPSLRPGCLRTLRESRCTPIDCP